MKRLLLPLFLTVILLTACSEEAPPTAQSPYFKAEQIEIPYGYELLDSQLDAYDGRVEVRVCTPYDENTREQDLFTLTYDTATGEYEIELVEDTESRTLYSKRLGERRFEVTGILGNMSYKSATLLEYSPEGEILRELDCGELFETELSSLRTNVAGDGNIFELHAIFEHKKRLYAVSNIGVAEISDDGTKRRLWQSDEPLKSASYVGERLILVTSERAYEFDLDALIPGEEFKLPEGHSATDILPLEGYELATRSSEGVYGFNRDSEGNFVETAVCDFGSVDVNSATVRNFLAVSPQEFYLIETNSLSFEHTLWRLTMIPSDEYIERTELTVAFYPTDNHPDIRQAIVDFNRRSDKFRFRVKVYAAADGGISNDDLATVKTRFAADIASGDVPDIVVMEDFLTNDSDDFEAQGLFCDLYALMDAAGYPRENILACQRETFERENPRSGETYLPYLALQTQVKTLLCDPADYDGRLTLEGLLDLQESGVKPTRFYSKWTPISTYLRYNLDRFIDSDGVPHFDSPLFMRMLEATRSDIKFDSEDEGLFSEYDISSPAKLVRDFVQNGIPVPHVAGYPDSDGSGVELTASKIIGVTEACENKDAAFELIEILLSDEYRCAKYASSIPMVTESSFEWYLDEKINRHYYVASNRMSISSPDPFDEHDLEMHRSTLGEGVYIILTDEFIEFLRETLLSARSEPAINDKIMEIVCEEYMSDHRTPAEIAEIINDRVEIVWNEKKR